MKTVIVCHGYARGFECPFVGQYLTRYDPNGDPADMGEWSRDPAKALQFDTLADAITCMMQERTAQPNCTGHGHKDRPLTAFNLSFEPVSAAAGVA